MLWKKNICLFASLYLFTAVFLSVFSIILMEAWAQETGERSIYDQAGLLNDRQIQDLEHMIAQAEQAVHMDLVVVTTSDAQGKSAREYADVFYIQGGFGTGKKHSGALFLIDMDNREIYISSSGSMIRFLTDSRVEQMLDYAYGQVSTGDYFEAMNRFTQDVVTYYQKGIESGQYNYDPETGEISRHRSIRWYEALFAFAAAGAVGYLPCRNIQKQYAMERERDQAAKFHFAYQANAAFTFPILADQLLDKRVSHTVIPRNRSGGGIGGSGSPAGRSTTHTTRGRTFGGGGRKF